MFKLTLIFAAIVGASAQWSDVNGVRKGPFCPTSKMQFCRMLCKPPVCPSGQCAMRQGSCCESKCVITSSGSSDSSDGEYNNGADNDGGSSNNQQSGSKVGGRCALGFCENAANCPKCAANLRCTPPGAHRPCAGTCFGTCMHQGDELPPMARPGGGNHLMRPGGH